MRICAHGWIDGWGQHTCIKEDGHKGRHLCNCDQEDMTPAKESK